MYTCRKIIPAENSQKRNHLLRNLLDLWIMYSWKISGHNDKPITLRAQCSSPEWKSRKTYQGSSSLIHQWPHAITSKLCPYTMPDEISNITARTKDGKILLSLFANTRKLLNWNDAPIWMPSPGSQITARHLNQHIIKKEPNRDMFGTITRTRQISTSYIIKENRHGLTTISCKVWWFFRKSDGQTSCPSLNPNSWPVSNTPDIDEENITQMLKY